MTLFNYLQQGGPVMYILCALSVISLAIIIYKFLQFLQLGIWKDSILPDALVNLRAGHTKQAINVLEKSNQPINKITKIAIECSTNNEFSASNTIAEIRRIGNAKLRDMESYLRSLSIIAHIAPLLGLLGTVFGMISAFIALEKAGGQTNPALLAGGIWEALLTTAFGLSVAIPTLAAYYFFEGQVENVKAKMKDAVSQILVIFSQTSERPEIKGSNITQESYGF